MSFNRTPMLIAAAGLVVAVVLFFVLRDSGEDDSTATTAAQTTTTAAGGDGSPSGGGDGQQRPTKPDEPEIPVIEIKDGQPVGGVRELDYEAGDQIRLVIESDIAEELHLHGYDVSKEIEAGGKATFDLPADIEGVFGLELENSGVPIAELTVNPS